MRVFRAWLPFVLVAILAGCAHVEANYPEPKTELVTVELPDKHVADGTYTSKTYAQLVWQREDEIHGFLTYWEDSSAMVGRMERAIDGRNPEAAKDAKRFRRMEDRGYGYLALWIYAAPQVEMLIRRGDLLITFEDGTSTVNQELFLYPVAAQPDPFQSTSSGAVLISGKADPYLQGRHFFIFVSHEWLNKTVKSVDFVGS